MADQNLNCNYVKLVPDIIDYHELEFITQKFEKNGFNLAERNNKNKQIWMKFRTRRFFAVATAKTRDAKIP